MEHTPERSWLDVDANGDDASIAARSGRRTPAADSRRGGPPLNYSRGVGVGVGVPESTSNQTSSFKTFLETNEPPRGSFELLESESDVKGSRSKKRKRLLCIGIIAAVLVVATGAILGGVLGSVATGRLGGGTSGPSTMTSSSATSSVPTATASPSLQAIRPKSRLAVTGWRGNQDFNIRLFYQDSTNNIRFSTHMSTTGGWSTSANVTNGQVMPGTPIAAGTIMDLLPPQVECYFINESLKLREQNFRDGVTPFTGNPGSLKDYSIAYTKESKLNMYWPLALSQGDDGQLFAVLYQDGKARRIAQMASAEGKASAKSGLALFPLKGTFESKETVGLYRSKAGQLSGMRIYFDTPKAEWVWSDWAVGNASLSIPETSPIAAFAVASSTNPGLINSIYALYQDSSNAIQFITYVDKVGWKASQPAAALGGADEGTDIACLTEAVFGQGKNLSSSRDMSRCYFQSGGKLKEVLYDGNTWTDLGFIPLT